MLAERVFVDPGLEPLPLQMGLGHELGQVLVALIAGGEQSQVRRPLPPRDFLFLMHRPGGQIDLATDDALHPRFFRRHVEVNGTIKIPVIRDANRRHPEFLGSFHQFRNPDRPI